jgi:hypothetical protein
MESWGTFMKNLTLNLGNQTLTLNWDVEHVGFTYLYFEKAHGFFKHFIGPIKLKHIVNTTNLMYQQSTWFHHHK